MSLTNKQQQQQQMSSDASFSRSRCQLTSMTSAAGLVLQILLLVAVHSQNSSGGATNAALLLMRKPNSPPSHRLVRLMGQQVQRHHVHLVRTYGQPPHDHNHGISQPNSINAQKTVAAGENNANFVLSDDAVQIHKIPSAAAATAAGNRRRRPTINDVQRSPLCHFAAIPSPYCFG